jgi:hypothetical protein
MTWLTMSAQQSSESRSAGLSRYDWIDAYLSSYVATSCTSRSLSRFS